MATVSAPAQTQQSTHPSTQHSLTFQLPGGKPLTIDHITLTLSHQNETLTECRLSFTLPGKHLKHLNSQYPFNLSPELRSPTTGGSFSPRRKLHIEAILKPDLLPTLQSHVHTPEAATDYLTNLVPTTPAKQTANPKAAKNAQTKPSAKPKATATPKDHPHPPYPPLLQTESWLALSVRQTHSKGDTSFKTFWDYVNPTTLKQTLDTGESLAKGLTDFFSEWFTANWADGTEALAAELTTELTQLFTDLDTLLTHPLTDPPPKAASQPSQPGQLLYILLDFFATENWPVAQLDHTTALQLAFQGNNGQWTCYAQANEARQEFLFYSICPAQTPAPKRPVMAEFLTRANYGLGLGNFEMHFDSGEIHYKTSIDVEGDHLSHALIRRLVYANVMIMDQYLPGIMSVIYSDTSAKEAIKQIEK